MSISIFCEINIDVDIDISILNLLYIKSQICLSVVISLGTVHICSKHFIPKWQLFAKKGIFWAKTTKNKYQNIDQCDIGFDIDIFDRLDIE